VTADKKQPFVQLSNGVLLALPVTTPDEKQQWNKKMLPAPEAR